MSAPAEPPPSRGRRHDTEVRIELAAIAAALEIGFENVTIDEICTRADIARSTFFTYFNARDSAVLGRALEVLDGDEAAAVLDAHAGDLALGTFHLIYASLAAMNADQEVARQRTELALTQPAASRAATALLTDAGTAIMAVLRDWLVEHPEHAHIPDSPELEANLSSNTVYAGLSTLPGGWAAVTADFEASTTRFRAALDDLRIIVGRQPSA